MVRTKDNELCQEESPRRCHECFPAISPQAFYMRKRFIQSHLELVDCFVAPTDYVALRYAEWGIPRSKLVVKPHSLPPISIRADDFEPVEEATHEVRPRNRFAYFGQLSPYKGADVLLEAIDLLGDDFDGELWIFGANLEIQNPAFRERFEALLSVERDNWVVVPSIWWETGPIVVREAFQNGRPVITSDIGGMSEKVTDGVDGLHFRTGDRYDLAETIRRAAETPGLWEELHEQVPREPSHGVTEDVQIMTAVYRRLLTADETTFTVPEEATAGA